MRIIDLAVAVRLTRDLIKVAADLRKGCHQWGNLENANIPARCDESADECRARPAAITDEIVQCVQFAIVHADMDDMFATTLLAATLSGHGYARTARVRSGEGVPLRQGASRIKP
ncbi:hypothetical protein O0R41_19615 [Sphingobium naphthae]|uniref:Uncharacterized protein n=1 Tax=Sphingobium naphthae TaxID=1886786 RepID=A0ABU4A201_9SPHN|nr:hypothetical protein [Sphingobium naphthae]MDV5825817.1 hypothetical protein [Sphingobium naphthae]